MEYRYKYSLVTSVVSLILLIFILMFSNPVNSGPVAIVAVLSVAFLFIYSATLFITAVLPKRIGWNLIQTRASRYYSSLAISVGCVYLLGLGSIGQLQLVDVVLVVVLEVVSIFYILRRS